MKKSYIITSPYIQRFTGKSIINEHRNCDPSGAPEFTPGF